MARLSRALRESATTTRYVGCFVAPTRVRRIRTAMGLMSLLGLWARLGASHLSHHLTVITACVWSVLPPVAPVAINASNGVRNGLIDRSYSAFFAAGASASETSTRPRTAVTSTKLTLVCF